MEGIVEWMAELSDCRLTLEPWEVGDVDVPGRLSVRRRLFPQPRTGMNSLSPVLNFRERFERLKNNSDEFWAAWLHASGLYRPVRANREKIAVFCHGGFGLCWLAHLEIPLSLMFSGFFHPSSVTTILFDERSQKWAVPRCIGMGDLSHLYAKGLPPAVGD
jgi:hypothetical protein